MLQRGQVRRGPPSLSKPSREGPAGDQGQGRGGGLGLSQQALGKAAVWAVLISLAVGAKMMITGSNERGENREGYLIFF